MVRCQVTMESSPVAGRTVPKAGTGAAIATAEATMPAAQAYLERFNIIPFNSLSFGDASEVVTSPCSEPDQTAHDDCGKTEGQRGRVAPRGLDDNGIRHRLELV